MEPKIVVDIETFDFAIRSVVAQLEGSERLDIIADALRSIFLQGGDESETRLKELVSEASISNLVNGTLIMLRSIISGIEEVERFAARAPTTSDDKADDSHENGAMPTTSKKQRRNQSLDANREPIGGVQAKKLKKEAVAAVRGDTFAVGTSRRTDDKDSNEPAEASCSLVQTSSDQKCAVAVQKINGKRRYPLTYKLNDGRYLCDFCAKTYAHPKDLRTHFQKAHERR